jgi:hypothetical protein
MSDHPLNRDEWGGFEEPEWADDDNSPDNDILELMDDEGEWLDEEDICEM